MKNTGFMAIRSWKKLQSGLRIHRGFLRKIVFHGFETPESKAKARHGSA